MLESADALEATRSEIRPQPLPGTERLVVMKWMVTCDIAAFVAAADLEQRVAVAFSASSVEIRGDRVGAQGFLAATNIAEYGAVRIIPTGSKFRRHLICRPPMFMGIVEVEIGIA